MKYISMKMEPKGRMPPSTTITEGSMNHFFSGMGRGTAFTRHGLLDWPDMLRPSTVPTSVSGRMMKKQMLATANCSERGGRGGVSVRVRMMLYSAAYHRGELDGARCVRSEERRVGEQGGC